METILCPLRKMTTVVADTGDMVAVARIRPVDCTTNPSLVLKSLENPHVTEIYQDRLDWGRNRPCDRARASEIPAERVAVALGARMAELVPGRNSTEVDARLSFDRDATIKNAPRLLEAYEEFGIGKDRILIKIASTWEGIQAPAHRQREGVDCNLMLISCLEQARAAADAGAYLISRLRGAFWIGISLVEK